MKLLTFKIWGMQVREWLVLIIFIMAMASCNKCDVIIQDYQSDLQGIWEVSRVVLIDEGENIFGYEDNPGIEIIFRQNNMCWDSPSPLDCDKFIVLPEIARIELVESGLQYEVYNLNEHTVQLAGEYSPSGSQRIIYYMKKIN